MNTHGEAQGVAADLELRTRLDQASMRQTPLAHAIDGLRIVVEQADRWLSGAPAQSDPTAAMRTIRRVAADACERAGAKPKQGRAR